MFDIGFQELMLVAIVALLVLGPDRLPGALRTLGLWMGRVRRSYHSVKTEIEREIGMDEVRRQLHNEAVMEELKRIEHDVRGPLTGSGITPRPGRDAAVPLAPAGHDPTPVTAPATAQGEGAGQEPLRASATPAPSAIFADPSAADVLPTASAGKPEQTRNSAEA